MKSTFEKFLRLRYAVWFLIALALGLVVVGELAYQRVVDTLRYGIALTETRIGSARILQLLTQAETGQRGYLLTGNAKYLERLDAAELELRGNKKVFEFIAGIGPTGPKDAERLYELAMQRFSAMSRSIAMVDTGDRPGALDAVKSGEGKQMMDTLIAGFDAKFAEAAKLQEDARTVIYDTLFFNRIVLLLLPLLIAVGLYWYARKLRQIDEERDTRQLLLETVVTQKTSDLRTLAGYLQTAREDEKAHLARELHDELGGLLTGAKLTLARMKMKLADNPDMTERIAQVGELLNRGIALKRKIIEGLRPTSLSTLGLNAALTAVCADASSQLGFEVQSSIAHVQLPAETELGIYRIVQEALTNIGKYADATQVRIDLQEAAGELVLEIEDNGTGFDTANLQPGQHGLAGMRFRVESLHGTMVLHSKPGSGVHIVVRLPR